MARRSIWPRAKHRVGLERPHLCTRFRGQSDAWVAPAHIEISSDVLPVCVAGLKRRQVKEERKSGEEGKNNSVHFQNWHFFTRRSAHGIHSEAFSNHLLCESCRAKKGKSGGSDPLFGGQSAQKFCPGRSRPLLHSGAHVFSPRAKQPRSWPSNSQVPVKWASPPYFTATSPATSPSIEHGITRINQMNRPEERNCARPRPRLRRERPYPLTHGASRLPCGRSRPHRNLGAAFCAVAYIDLRICQTRCLTFCMKTKGEARCLY